MAESTMPKAANDSNFRILLQENICAVGTAIVVHQNLQIIVGLVQDAANAVAQKPFSIVCGNEYGNGIVHFSRSITFVFTRFRT